MTRDSFVFALCCPPIKEVVIVDHDGKMWDIGGVLIVDGVAKIQLMELIVDADRQA